MKTIHLATCMVSAVLATGCCSIIHGTSQEVPVNSVPSGAQVFHNGVPAGTTPALLDLKRKRHHVIRLEKAGYVPAEKTLSKSTSGWVAGNIVFGGLIGLAVDAVNGSFYNISPDAVDVVLLPDTQSAEPPPTGETPDAPEAGARQIPDPATAAVRLKQIAELHDSGILTDEEYEAKRETLIQSL